MSDYGDFTPLSLVPLYFSDVMSYHSEPVCFSVYTDLLVFCSQHGMFIFFMFESEALAFVVLSVPPIDDYMYCPR